MSWLDTTKNKLDELIAISHALHEFKNNYKLRPWISPVGEFLVEKGYLQRAEQGIMYATSTKEMVVQGQICNVPVAMKKGILYFYSDTSNLEKNKKLLEPLKMFSNPVDFEKEHNYRTTLPVKLNASE